MGPVVEDQDRAVGQARTQIVQAIERGQVDVAIDANVVLENFSATCSFRALEDVVDHFGVLPSCTPVCRTGDSAPKWRESRQRVCREKFQRSGTTIGSC